MFHANNNQPQKHKLNESESVKHARKQEQVTFASADWRNL